MTICVRNLIPSTRGYLMSRHFVWLTPLSNLTLFSATGFLLAVVAWLWPRRGAWLPAAHQLPDCFAGAHGTSPRLYPIAWMMLAAGFASCVAASRTACDRIADGCSSASRFVSPGPDPGWLDTRGRLAAGAQ